MQNHANRPSGGFTLVEMAVVLVIVGLMLGGLLMPLSTQMENDRRKETAATLAAIQDALIGYAAINGRLPCPDNNTNGLDDDACASGAGQPHVGALPYATLGVSPNDAWNRPWRYAVSRPFTSTAMTINTTGSIRVWDQNGCGAGTRIADQLPALVMSEGTSRLTASPLEMENINAPNDCFVEAAYIQGNTGFNDLLTWVPVGTLMNRMLVSGQL